MTNRLDRSEQVTLTPCGLPASRLASAYVRTSAMSGWLAATSADLISDSLSLTVSAGTAVGAVGFGSVSSAPRRFGAVSAPGAGGDAGSGCGFVVVELAHPRTIPHVR